MNADNTAPVNMLRLLHPLSAIALIVGIVIGAGIFKTPSMVAGISGDAGWALVLWVAGDSFPSSAPCAMPSCARLTPVLAVITIF